jgi:hypothetical protein
MKFVVKECLSAGFRASSAGAASLDGILFGKLLFDFSRKRFGEDSSRSGRPEAAALTRSSTRSAIYRVKSQRSPPIALVNNSERGVCDARAGSPPESSR